MIPLWTTTNSFVSSDLWGWLLRSLGTPWVAHRVCAIPTCKSSWQSKSELICLQISSSRTLTFPGQRTILICLSFWSNAIPKNIHYKTYIYFNLLISKTNLLNHNHDILIAAILWSNIVKFLFLFLVPNNLYKQIFL